ncbi:MAG: hypothetical protein AAB461_03285 [Patescibacteria group bacterium]
MANDKDREGLYRILPPLIIICFGIVLALMLYYFNYNFNYTERMEYPPNVFFGISD